MDLKEHNFGDESLYSDEVKGSHAVIYSVLAYFGILWLVGFLIAPEKEFEFTKHHVNNGLLCFIVDIAIGIIFIIPILGKIIYALVALVLLAIRVCGIIQACYGKTFNIPYVEKIKLVK